MTNLDSPVFDPLAKELAQYELNSTVPYLAGLLTVPALHCNGLRLETLVHLAVAHCNGTRTPSRVQVLRWLNSDLASLTSFEAPSEDVFIANVETAKGNRLIFQGDWVANAYYTQAVLAVLNSDALSETSASVASSSMALLKIGDYVANRLGFERWTQEACIPHADFTISSDDEVRRHLTAVTLTDAALATLGITRQELEPFLFRDPRRRNLLRERLGHTSLERRPLISHGSRLVLALPAAIGPAIRRFVIAELEAAGFLSQFSMALAKLQTRQVHVDGLRHLRWPSQDVAPPASPRPLPPLSHRLVAYDYDKYIQLIILQDPHLGEITTKGLNSLFAYSSMANTNLSTQIKTVATSCQAKPGFSQGWTIFLVGGVGRGVMLDVEDTPDPWIVSLISIADFLLLTADIDNPLDHFLQLLVQHRSLQVAGPHLLYAGNDYDIYCHWVESGYRLVPPDMPAGVDVVALPPDVHQLSLRSRVRRSTDAHAAATPSGHYSPAVRFTMGAIVNETNPRPTYVGLEYLRAQVLAGFVSTDRGLTWLFVRIDSDDPKLRAFAYQFWTGLMDLYDRLVFAGEQTLPFPSGHSAVSVVLDVRDVTLPTPEQQQPSLVDSALDAGFGWEISNQTATVRCPPNLLQYFRQPTNTGERLIVHALALASLALHTQQPVEDIDANDAKSLVDTVLADPGARILHMFTSYNVLTQVLSMNDPGQRHFPAVDYTSSKIQLWRDLCSQRDTSAPLSSPIECTTFLNSLVSTIWLSIRDLLRTLDRRTFIQQMLAIHERGIAGRALWHRTARAMLALRADALKLWQQNESERTNIQLPVRIAVEMGLCECPVQGGRVPSQWDIDTVIARILLLLKTATDSDTLYHEIVKPDLHILPGGDYVMSREFYDETMKPFIAQGWSDVYTSAADRYERYYDDENVNGETNSDTMMNRPEFIEAYTEEYGLAPAAMLRAITALGEWAIESRNVVVETTSQALKARLVEHAKLNWAEAERFLGSFGLVSRPEWDNPPDGFELRDIKPWRYTRRLSLVAKPMITWETGESQTVMFGAGTLINYIVDNLKGTMEGTIWQEIFTTAKMKRYRGDATRRLGSQFAKDTARKLRARGWSTRVEITIRSLGGPKRLGDVDVLAWNAERRVVVVECKRLQMARTVAEIAELCKRFRGEANDNLEKHLRRAEWIRNNREALRSVIGFVPDLHAIDDRVVTNVRVPMTYLSSLPIAAHKIGPLMTGSFGQTAG